jgi:two-component system, OmpR family, sensor kinase
MSSSPPTDVGTSRRRHPAGWSLRTQLVAIMIALLAVLGLAVGGTVEVALHNTLYDQVNTKLLETDRFAYRGPGQALGQAPTGRRFGATRPPPGAQRDWIILQLGPTAAPDGIVRVQQETDAEGNVFDSLGYGPLPSAAAVRLAQLTPDGGITDVNLGALGDYRAIATPHDGAVTVTAAPLRETQQTLLTVALVTGLAVLLALGTGGWAGAVIIRRTLRPLARVAATATRVSELELDRGAVDLAQRVPAADTDPRTEVGQVGAALNRMLDHVGRALEARHHSETQVRQFVADASHELRTPLAAIRGYAELSRRGRQPVPVDVAHVLRRVESEAQRMTELVEDLLLLARLDAGRPLAHDPVDLTMLVVDAVSDAHAAGPRHDWQLDLPAEPVVVEGDGARLHQVLGNLLANARTHTPEGTTVTVGVRAAAEAALVTVTDAGPGIPAELQPHVFERFARGDGSRSRAAGSTGLGLSIVHAVVTAHGGTVAMESAPGRTRFTVRLPLGAGPAAGPEVHRYAAQTVR